MFVGTDFFEAGIAFFTVSPLSSALFFSLLGRLTRPSFCLLTFSISSSIASCQHLHLVSLSRALRPRSLRLRRPLTFLTTRFALPSRLQQLGNGGRRNRLLRVSSFALPSPWASDPANRRRKLTLPSTSSQQRSQRLHSLECATGDCSVEGGREPLADLVREPRLGR